MGKCCLCWNLPLFNLLVYCTIETEYSQDFLRSKDFLHIAQKLFQILFILPLTFSHFNRLKQNKYPPPPLTCGFLGTTISLTIFYCIYIIAYSQGFTIDKLHKLSFSFCAFFRPAPVPACLHLLRISIT